MTVEPMNNQLKFSSGSSSSLKSGYDEYTGQNNDKNLNIIFFSFEFQETAIQTMAVGEVAEFQVDKTVTALMYFGDQF